MKNKHLKEIEDKISASIALAMPMLATSDFQVLVYEEDDDIVVGLDVHKPCESFERETLKNVLQQNGCKNIEAVDETVLSSDEGFRLYATAA